MVIEIDKLKEKSGGMETTPKNLRVFGIGAGVILTAIWALRLYVLHHGNAWPFLVIAGYFFLTGLFIHSLLKPVYKVWTWVAKKIGWFNTRLLLGILFYIILTPTGVLMRFIGRDPMKRKLEPKRESYWLPYKRKFEMINYEKEF